MLTLLASFGLSLLASFIGSFIAFVIWVHWHLEEHWEDRKARIAYDRQRRRLDRLSEEERLNLEGRSVISDGKSSVGQ